MSGLIAAGMTAGSIEGRGTYFLGSKALTVGGNNLSTTVSGTISDGGAFGRNRRFADQGRYWDADARRHQQLHGSHHRHRRHTFADRRYLVVQRRDSECRRHARRHRNGAGRHDERRNVDAGHAERDRHPQCRRQSRVHIRRHLPHQHQCDDGEPDQRHGDRDTRWSDRSGRRRQEHHEAPSLHPVDGNRRCQRDLQSRRGRRKEQGRAVL